MCGIAGFLGDYQQRDTHAVRAKTMADTLLHRGPDDGGVWLEPDSGLALAHRRLSVLDLSPEGHQPMVSACGRYVIVFNGEIYNFRELRQELEQNKTVTWRGSSDTEVMLAAIRAWGLPRALEKFVGMFAFALWDRERRTLSLARDRLGEKPLYYGRQGNVFLFGSELKALRVHPAFRGEIDRNALAMMQRYAYVPTPYSIYRGVQKLPPGTFLTLSSDVQQDVMPTAYWSARQAAEQGQHDPFTGSDQEAIAELDRILNAAIDGQMVADVPLGAFLSGGVDSSVVVALMQTRSTRPVKTFSIGFWEEAFNEAEYAQAVAHHLGTEHTPLYVTPEEALAVIPRIPTLYDEPYGDSSQIPTFLVSQLARQHVTVSLSGDGGDELFGGYNRYFWAADLWRKLGWAPQPIRGAAASLLTLVRPSVWNRMFRRLTPLLPKTLRYANPGDKLHKLADMLTARHPEEIYRGLVSLWKDPEVLVTGSQALSTLLDDPRDWPNLREFEQRMMYLDLVTYLPDDILVKVDRAAMGVSLETRVPLLDHRLVEFAWRLPLNMKIRGTQSKWLLRQVLYQYLPKHLIERPKMGFGVPLAEWLRGPLRAWSETLLDPARLKQEGYFNPQIVHTHWDEHLSGRRNWSYQLWNVLVFQAWLESHGLNE
jgi:asparagine synthase (glutamine-hydrolysing)